MDSMDFMDMMDGVIQSAMRYEISKAHGTQYAMCQACPPKPPAKEGPYKSVQVRIPLPSPCALRNVPCQSSGGSRARQGDSRQSPRPMFGWRGPFAAAIRAKKIPQPASGWRIEKTLASISG